MRRRGKSRKIRIRKRKKGQYEDPKIRRSVDIGQLKSLGCRIKRVDVVYGSTRKHNGDVGNPEKVLQNGMDRNGGGGKSMRTIV